MGSVELIVDVVMLAVARADEACPLIPDEVMARRVMATARISLLALDDEYVTKLLADRVDQKLHEFTLWYAPLGLAARQYSACRAVMRAAMACAALARGRVEDALSEAQDSLLESTRAFAPRQDPS